MTDSLYTTALADEILRRMSEGESLRSVCKEAGMPSEGTVRGWSREDRDGFAARYRLARDLQLDHWADLIVDLADRWTLIHGIGKFASTPASGSCRSSGRADMASACSPRSKIDSPIKVLHDQVNLTALSPEQLDAVERLAMAMLVQKGGD